MHHDEPLLDAGADPQIYRQNWWLFKLGIAKDFRSCTPNHLPKFMSSQPLDLPICYGLIPLNWVIRVRSPVTWHRSPAFTRSGIRTVAFDCDALSSPPGASKRGCWGVFFITNFQESVTTDRAEQEEFHADKFEPGRFFEC